MKTIVELDHTDLCELVRKHIRSSNGFVTEGKVVSVVLKAVPNVHDAKLHNVSAHVEITDQPPRYDARD